MDLQRFTEMTADGLKKFLGAEVEVKIRDIRKNNGVYLKGMTILDRQSNISPTIYLNSFYQEYEEGKTLGTVVREIAEIYEKTRINGKLNMDFFTDYERTKKRIFCKLINYDKNQEMLTETPHRKVLDLAMVCYYSYVNDMVGSGTITICNSHLENWGISGERLLEEAMDNTQRNLQYRWYSMREMMKEMLQNNIRDQIIHFPVPCGEEFPEEWAEQMAEQMLREILNSDTRGPMYVLTNCNKFLGAVCMIFPDIMEDMAEVIGSGFLILPSSIHEVILLPEKEAGEVEELKKLVHEVNDTQVEPHEILSDSVYYYDRLKKQVLLL